MKQAGVLVVGIFLLLFTELSKVYFIMPFPGSQQGDTIGYAYFINNNIWWIRLLLILLTLPALYAVFSKGKVWKKVLFAVLIVTYGLVFYMVNDRFLADKMFYQPSVVAFMKAAADTGHLNKLVIGVAINGESKAYPIEIIGYHHQVLDTVGNAPVMVTYCTVCRTGRVYAPFVNGKYEKFRLVGMDHFNAMFEDFTTKSWWQQATGRAITGKLKGTQLKEMASSQMRLGDWLQLHPESLVLVPDAIFISKYDSLKGYDEGILKSSLEKRDSGSWAAKSWVIGIAFGKVAKAFDWNQLQQDRIIQDSLNGIPLLLTIDSTNKSFYAMDRRLFSQTLRFENANTNGLLRDRQTGSLWQVNGNCIEGFYKGKQMLFLQAYQEFWHSWKTFHPGTLK